MVRLQAVLQHRPTGDLEKVLRLLVGIEYRTGNLQAVHIYVSFGSPRLREGLPDGVPLPYSTIPVNLHEAVYLDRIIIRYFWHPRQLDPDWVGKFYLEPPSIEPP